MKIITIDYDGTLELEEVQEYARKLLFNGQTKIYIVTARLDDLHLKYGSHEATNADLYSVADRLGIKRERIFFTNGRLKYKFFRDTTPGVICFHLDNEAREIKQINKRTFIKGVLLKDGWQERCDQILKLCEN